MHMLRIADKYVHSRRSRITVIQWKEHTKSMDRKWTRNRNWISRINNYKRTHSWITSFYRTRQWVGLQIWWRYVVKWKWYSSIWLYVLALTVSSMSFRCCSVFKERRVNMTVGIVLFLDDQQRGRKEKHTKGRLRDQESEHVFYSNSCTTQTQCPIGLKCINENCARRQTINMHWHRKGRGIARGWSIKAPDSMVISIYLWDEFWRRTHLA